MMMCDDFVDLFDVFVQVVGGIVLVVDVLDVGFVGVVVLLVGFECMSVYLMYYVFNCYYFEIEMLCYLCSLLDKDFVFDCLMILFGLCMMKLNVMLEMLFVMWFEFGWIYLFVLVEQIVGYCEMIDQFEQMFVVVIGYVVVLLQLNVGLQGEYVGFLIIYVYYVLCGEGYCDVCLILVFVYGMNLVFVYMVGMKVVVVVCDVQGNVDIVDLKVKVEQYLKDFVVIMIMYLLMYGVFEQNVCEICEIVYVYGGQVYVDGVNMNVMVGLIVLGQFGGDVLYLNLYKIFCILYGGGGLGVGLVVVGVYFVKFLLNQCLIGYVCMEDGIGVVLVVLYGLVLILLILWMYIVMMGVKNLIVVMEIVIFNVNYIVKCFVLYYLVLYLGLGGFVVYECIFDLCLIKEMSGISVDDVVKCLMDYGFYVLMMSFLVLGMLMVELIELELQEEFDCFIVVMIVICEEICVVEEGCVDCEDNLLCYVLYMVVVVIVNEWLYVYLCEQVVYLVVLFGMNKYWLLVGCVDNVYGDCNLFCLCVLMLDYV